MNKWSEREKDKSLMCFQILRGMIWKGCGHQHAVLLSGASRHCSGMPVISQDTSAHLYLSPGPQPLWGHSVGSQVHLLLHTHSSHHYFLKPNYFPPATRTGSPSGLLAQGTLCQGSRPQMPGRNITK